MSTYDQMIIDDQYLFSKQSKTQQQQTLDKDDDDAGPLGRRVYLESPSFDNKEEEDMYRYVPSRLSGNTSTVVGATAPARTGAVLMDSLDFEFDLLGANNNRPTQPYRTTTQVLPESKSSATRMQLPTHKPRADPRQDPLLGPLLAELDAMSYHQQLPPPPPPIYRRNSVPYELNYGQPSGLSQTNYALTNTVNRTVTDALNEAELYDSLDPREQQRQPIAFSAPNINSSNHYLPQQQQPSHSSHMDGTDIFIPSSYNAGPGTFLSHFDADDQLFQRSTLNALGQNYVPHNRPLLPQQRDISFDQAYARITPSLRTAYIPPNHNNEHHYQQQQRDISFDQSHARISPPQRTPYISPTHNNDHHYQQQQQLPPPPSNQQNPNPFHEHQRLPPPQHYEEQIPRQRLPPPPPPQHYEEQIPRQRQPMNNQDMFFTDHNDDQLEQNSFQQPPGSQRSGDPQDPDSKRQAVWDELQRTNAKFHEKNTKKRESTNRLKGPYNSNTTVGQQSFAQIKSPQRHQHYPPPVSKGNYIEENIDMIKNKENFYHRYPAKQYENAYSKRKDRQGGSVNDKYEQEESKIESTNDPQYGSSAPVTANFNSGDNSQNGSLPGTITIPLDSHVNRVGDKISLNIDLRLVDLQNLKQQQNAEHPNWSGLDPLDQHIRKLERGINRSLPPTHAPQRSPAMPSTGINAPTGRYGRTATGVGRGGYNPPLYGGNYYNYGDKGQEEDSYLAKMNYTKKTPQFKPYTGRDYEQFKKNYGFGTGHLGANFESTTYKEKTEKLAKTREYAQHVEARNKKNISSTSRRTLSDTRIPTEAYKPQRPLTHIHTSTRTKQLSGTSIRSSPPTKNGFTLYAPTRRPTEVPHQLPPVRKQSSRLSQYENNEVVQHLPKRHEQDKLPMRTEMNPSQKRHESFFDDDDDDDRRVNDIERPAQAQPNQRRLSPPRHLPPTGQVNSENKRRPIKFDKPLLPDEPTHPPPQQRNPPQQQSNVDESAKKHHEEKMVMEIIRQQLADKPLNENEELVIVEQ